MLIHVVFDLGGNHNIPFLFNLGTPKFLSVLIGDFSFFRAGLGFAGTVYIDDLGHDRGTVLPAELVQ